MKSVWIRIVEEWNNQLESSRRCKLAFSPPLFQETFRFLTWCWRYYLPELLASEGPGHRLAHMFRCPCDHGDNVNQLSVCLVSRQLISISGILASMQLNLPPSAQPSDKTCCGCKQPIAGQAVTQQKEQETETDGWKTESEKGSRHTHTVPAQPRGLTSQLRTLYISYKKPHQCTEIAAEYRLQQQQPWRPW